MDIFLYDGLEARKQDGSSVPLSSIHKNDLILVMDGHSDTMMDVIEDAIQEREEKLRSDGFSSIRAMFGTGIHSKAVIFSFPGRQHRIIRESSKAKICDGDYTLALSNGVTASESMLVCNRHGDYAFISLWIDGMPYQHEWIAFESLHFRIDAAKDELINKASSAKFAVISNMVPETFESLKADIAASPVEIDVSVIQTSLADITDKMIDFSSQAEYVTEDEFRAKMRQRARRRKLVNAAITSAFMIPGIFYGGHSFLEKNSLHQELNSLTSKVKHEMSLLNADVRRKGGNLFYGQGDGISHLLNFFYSRGVSHADISKVANNLYSFEIQLPEGKNLGVPISGMSIKRWQTVLGEKSGVHYVITGSYKAGGV